jgi:hypothetical protein
MAEPSIEDRKFALSVELERSRAQLAREMRGVRSGLDVSKHVKQAVLRQKTLWFAGAAIAGWLVTRLPGRGKKEKAEPQPQPLLSRLMPQPKQSARGGWALALLGLLGTLLKPALTSFLSQKVAELTTRDQQTEPPRRHARR